MTPIEGETAVGALSLCAVAPWVLFGARIWKVASPGRPPKADAATEASAPAASPPKPTGWEKRQRDPKTGQFLPDPQPLREVS